MNILFITLVDIRSIESHGIYTDLMREFVKNGHEVYIASPAERRCNIETQILETGKAHILKVKTGNIQKTNIIEKGISTVLLEYQLLAAIKKCFAGVRFDLILYSTPPITLVKPIKYLKNRDHAKTYLMLKDIFPQNAVDIGMMSITGLKGVLYHFFRKKEKKLYALSDGIGCMSRANVDYVLKHNPEIPEEKVEICPNAIEVQDVSMTLEERETLRAKYRLPQDKKIFVYGGNLGRPQGIPFLIDCLRACGNAEDAFFLIVGSGTEYGKIERFMEDEKPGNVRLMRSLPRDDYDKMIAACDVGMIFLDHRFTIPNFPSRLLSYMQAGLPVLAVTDPNTDVGKVIEAGGFGWWCESNDIEGFSKIIHQILSADTVQMGRTGFERLLESYPVEAPASVILRFCAREKKQTS